MRSLKKYSNSDPCENTLSMLRRQCAQTLRSLSSTTSATPWFVDTDVPSPAPARPARPSNVPPLPADVPPTLQSLHAELAGVPHLDAEHLTVSRAMMFMPGPPLPLRMPQGRRKRGGTYPGESMYDTPCGIWNWIVLAQVRASLKRVFVCLTCPIGERRN